MKCPFCQFEETRVVDSRWVKTENSIKRRRKCDKCERRFTTFETLSLSMPTVIKSDGRREPFDRKKIEAGLIKATQKRPISYEKIKEIVNDVEKQALDFDQREVPSMAIGEFIIEKLKALDTVSYVRFASVYKTFKDIDEFVSDL